MVEFFSEEIDFVLENQNSISDWIINVATHESKSVGDISYIFCSDDYLLEINKEHLDHDYYTDIITFDYTEEDEISGDLFISIDRVKDNASVLDQTFINELHRVIIHGVLHLCGYKDKSEKDAQLMREMEDKSLNLRTF